MPELRVPDLIEVPPEFEDIRAKRTAGRFPQAFCPPHDIIISVPDRSTLWRRLTRQTMLLRLMRNNQVVIDPKPRKWWQ